MAMNGQFDRELATRLRRSGAIDSQSDDGSATQPGTARHLVVLRRLVERLTAMGAADVRLTGYGVVLATIPATAGVNAATIGFLADVDTAPAFPATGVQPVVHRACDGGDIHFADAPDLGLSPAAFPCLAAKVGDDSVTASGTPLLGAGDKAGVAILTGMARYLPGGGGGGHGRVRLAFTPDEEIGRGVTARRPADPGVDFADTLAGSERGMADDDSFSADRAEVTIKGVSAHPGDADRGAAGSAGDDAGNHQWATGVHPYLSSGRHRSRGQCQFHMSVSSCGILNGTGWRPRAIWCARSVMPWLWPNPAR